MRVLDFSTLVTLQRSVDRVLQRHMLFVTDNIWELQVKKVLVRAILLMRRMTADHINIYCMTYERRRRIAARARRLRDKRDKHVFPGNGFAGDDADDRACVQRGLPQANARHLG
jgi:hypothetical protein